MAFKSLATSGIVNSAKYQNALVGNSAFSPGAYELISTTTLSGTQATISFSSIVQTYKHLQIRVAGRSDISGDADAVVFNFNGDTGNNYAYHGLFGYNNTLYSNGAASQAYGLANNITAATATTSTFGAFVMDILDYTGTKNKTTRTIGGLNSASYQMVRLNSSVWLNTAAITSITLKSVSGGNFVAGSRFSLYGIKGA